MRAFATITTLVILMLTLSLVGAQPEWKWTYHDECVVFSMAFNNRGDLALAFGYNAILLQPNGSRLFKAPVRGLAYSVGVSDNGIVIAGTDGNWVQFFGPDGKLLREYKTENVVYSVDISPDGKTAVAGNVDGFVYFFKGTELEWKRSIGSYLWSVDLVGENVLAGGDNGRFVAFKKDGSVLFNVSLSGDVKKVAGDEKTVVALVVSRDETSSAVYAFDWKGNELWERHFEGLIRDMEFDGEYIAIAGDLDEVVLLNRDGNNVYSIPFYLTVVDVAMAQGYTLVAGDLDAMLVAPNGTILWEYSPNETVEKAAISPDARYLALSRRAHGKDICEADVDFMEIGGSEVKRPISEETPKRNVGNPFVAVVITMIVALTAFLVWREMRE